MQIYSEPIIDFDNDFLHTMVLPDSGKEAGKWSFFSMYDSRKSINYYFI